MFGLDRLTKYKKIPSKDIKRQEKLNNYQNGIALF
jgi:hypothetical protein